MKLEKEKVAMLWKNINQSLILEFTYQKKGYKAKLFYVRPSVADNSDGYLKHIKIFITIVKFTE